MKLALVGEHSDLTPVLGAVSASGRHVIRWAACVGAETMPLIRSAEILPQWETLLALDQVDAVLVAGTTEVVRQAARQMAAERVPLVILPAAGMGSAFLYELSLVRDDLHVPLFPFFPVRRHRLLADIRHHLQEEAYGKLLQLELERTEPGESRIPLGVSDHRLLWDVDLLRQLGGDYDQITAFRAGADASRVISQSVTFAGRGLPEATWNHRLGPESAWMLRLRLDRGEASIEGRNSYTLTEIRRADGWTESPRDDDFAGAVREELDDIEAVIAAASLDDGWSEFVREMETVESTYQSVRRRRTIDLHREVTSERNQFKTQMSALGCGVLLLTLILLIAVLIAGQAFEIAAGPMKLLRILVFAPLFCFLLLQLLIGITRPSADQQADETATPRA